MADKTQNITINYKFNTSEAAQAEAILHRANAATNKLQQSAGKAGSAINQEFQKSNKTILDMQTALTRLRSVIEVTSNPAKLKALSAEYRNIKTQLDAATKSAYGFDAAIKNQGAGVQSLTAKFGGLYTAVQAVVGAAVVRQVASMTLELARLAGNAEGIERAFERAFPNSVTLLNELREATHGTVNDMELMQRTLQATNLGVAVKELPTLFEFAAVRAQQTGESVDYLVDSIVRGIGRKSPLILDNLGLSATRLKEKFDGAALASQSVADVTAGVAEIAREELEKMGGHIETGATKVAQLEAAWTQLRINFARRIDSSGIINFFKEAFQGASEALKTEAEITKERIKQRAAIEFQSLKENQLAETRRENGKLIQQTNQELVNATQDEIRERMKLIEAGRVEYAILQEKYKTHNDTKDATGAEVLAAMKAREEIVKQGLSLKNNLKFHEETIKLLRAYSDELLKQNDVEKESTGIIERKKKEIEKIQEKIQKSNKLSDLGVGGKLTSQLEIAQAELVDLQNAFLDFKAVEFETEITNATKTLTDFKSVIDRIDADIRDGIEGTKPPQVSTYTPTDWDIIKDDFVSHWQDITSIGIDIQADQLKSLAEAELQNMDVRLQNLRDFYDEQQLLAGDNDRAKAVLRIKEERETEKLRKDMARKEKEVRRKQALIDIAAGIAKAFATYPWPYALIPAAIVAATGASNLAMINRQNFAKGVIGIKGPGTETSDSIPVNVSRNESIMTGWETRHAGDVLKDIRAKKLDNKTLKQLKEGRSSVLTPQKVDNSDIVKAIKDQKRVDVVKEANLLYEVKTYTGDYKKRIRSRSMGGI
jgi:hypothetical protein